eukprot:jgi/Antlo1/193/928
MLLFFLFVTATYALTILLAYAMSCKLKNAENGQIFRYVSIGGLTSMYIAWAIVFASQVHPFIAPEARNKDT